MHNNSVLFGVGIVHGEFPFLPMGSFVHVSPVIGGIVPTIGD